MDQAQPGYPEAEAPLQTFGVQRERICWGNSCALFAVHKVEADVGVQQLWCNFGAALRFKLP